jgi:hypothetical protein
VRLAVSDRTGGQHIALQDDSQTHSLETPLSAATGARRATEQINLTTLDDYLRDWQDAAVDLLKIDTEGHELAVLRGARDLLARGRVRSLFIEASLDPHDEVHTPLHALQAALAPHGFHLAACYDQAVATAPARLGYFNAFFVREQA